MQFQVNSKLLTLVLQIKNNNDEDNEYSFPSMLPIKILYTKEGRIVSSILVAIVCILFFVPIFLLFLFNIKKKLIDKEEGNIERSITKSYKSDKDDSVILLGMKESK